MARYRGPLTSAQALEGARACVRNAEELLDECELLIKHGRCARAVALALVAFEEMGKLLWLLGSPIYGSDTAEWTNFWKRFRSHKAKIFLQDYVFPVPSVRPDYDAASPNNMLAPWAEYASLREAALYADFEEDEFIAPSAREPMADLAPRLLGELRHVLAYHRVLAEHVTPERLEEQLARSADLLRQETVELPQGLRAKLADMTPAERLEIERELAFLFQEMLDEMRRQRGEDAKG
jgi:AbiV family abortive infection protein